MSPDRQINLSNSKPEQKIQCFNVCVQIRHHSQETFFTMQRLVLKISMCVKTVHLVDSSCYIYIRWTQTFNYLVDLVFHFFLMSTMFSLHFSLSSVSGDLISSNMTNLSRYCWHCIHVKLKMYARLFSFSEIVLRWSAFLKSFLALCDWSQSFHFISSVCLGGEQ